jgi:phage baseplate assembly protein gpV
MAARPGDLFGDDTKDIPTAICSLPPSDLIARSTSSLCRWHARKKFWRPTHLRSVREVRAWRTPSCSEQIVCPFRASSFPRDWIRSELINITRNHDSYYKDSDLFRVGNQFTHDMDVKRLGINPLVKRCGINPALWFLVVLIMMSKLVLKPE